MTESTNGEGGADRVAAAFDHLQSAALEMIAAVRSVLDLAEDLVKDPPLPAASALVSLIAQSWQSLQPLIADERPDHSGGGPMPAPRVEHIRVS